MARRIDNSGQGSKSNWRWIVVLLAALAIIGGGVAYKYTGDFTGLVKFGTSGRPNP
jgi:hypothetical protein